MAHALSLWAIHLPKSRMLGEVPLDFIPNSFCLDTCQRRVWIYWGDQLPQSSMPDQLQGLEILYGTEAYAFLLRVTTGLESEVKGETDIFGQFKAAWQKYDEAAPYRARSLDFVIQRLIEDTKEIRSRYLQNVGGASYGSLVRKLIKQNPLQLNGPTLLIGAGQIARAVAPWLLSEQSGSKEVWVWNRSEASLMELAAEVHSKSAHFLASQEATMKIFTGAEQELALWEQAAQVIVCIPTDPFQDTKRIASCHAQRVIHLGCLRDQSGEWSTLPQFYCLDDLFALQKQQQEARQLLFHAAFNACREKAQLRWMAAVSGGSISLPHGWEDLAVFI